MRKHRLYGAERDLKEMLAYSSIENIGNIGIAIGTAMLGSALALRKGNEVVRKALVFSMLCLFTSLGVKYLA